MSNTVRKKFIHFLSCPINPNHIISKLLLGVSLGIAFVGFMLLAFLFAVREVIYKNVDITLGTGRVSLFIASLSYILFIIVARKKPFTKVPNTEGSANSSDSIVVIKTSRAA